MVLNFHAVLFTLFSMDLYVKDMSLVLAPLLNVSSWCNGPEPFCC
jgi:hypothetical protein